METTKVVPVTSIRWGGHVEDGPVPPSNFVTAQSSINASHLPEGNVLVELLYLSVDPYMRGRMRDMKASYFVGPFETGKPLSGGGIGLVRAANGSSKFKEGDVVSGMMPWSTFFLADAAAQDHMQKVDPSLLGKVPLSWFLGTLGMPGMTAYASLRKIAEPKAGEVAFVSGAAGAVGLVACQLLKHVYGCKVIGSAGTDDKVALLKQVGVDYAFNYKTKGTAEALAEAAPDGVDVYFDNVGGKTLEDVLTAASNHARIVACGQISQYDAPEAQRYGVKNLFNVVTKRLKMQGFIVSDYAAELGADFAKDMAQYVLEGKLVVKEKIFDGITNAGNAFADLMAGGNTGKQVVKVVAEDPYPVLIS